MQTTRNFKDVEHPKSRVVSKRNVSEEKQNRFIVSNKCTYLLKPLLFMPAHLNK